MHDTPTSAQSSRDRAHHLFLNALNACAALYLGASAHKFTQAYCDAFFEARLLSPHLTEDVFRESFFWSTGRLFGAQGGSRFEQALGNEVALAGRRALATSFQPR